LHATSRDATRGLPTLRTTVASDAHTDPRSLRDWPKILASRTAFLMVPRLQRAEPRFEPFSLVSRQVLDAFNVSLDQRLQTF